MDAGTWVMELPLSSWEQQLSAEEQKQAQLCLESGGVLLFPGLAFSLESRETPLLAMDDPTDGNSKNVSLDSRCGELRGCCLEGGDRAIASQMMARYSQLARSLVLKLCPGYDQHLITQRTSWRPIEIEGRLPASWRKDDRLVHVDAFPSSPTGGQRLLRVFTNIHPNGRERIWEVGEGFEAVSARFLTSVPAYSWTWAKLLEALRITRALRTSYDHVMLYLHDLMKGDSTYQAQVPRQRLRLAPGTTWITYTDQCSHSAHAGAQALEQTFAVERAGLAFPEKSPYEILRAAGALQGD
jgi:hypothetical protein